MEHESVSFIQSEESGKSIIGKSLEFFEKIIEDYEFNSVIDFGCGYGNHVELFNQKGKDAYGIDIDFVPEALHNAKEKGYTLIKNSWSDVKNKKFDAGWSHHSLEHARDPISWLNEWGNLIKPNGKLFIVVPSYKTRVLAGHINTGWNPSQLAYILAVAGWDCRDGRFEEKNKNVYGIVTRPETMKIHDTHVFGFGSAAEMMPKTMKKCDRGVSYSGEPNKIFSTGRFRLFR